MFNTLTYIIQWLRGGTKFYEVASGYNLYPTVYGVNMLLVETNKLGKWRITQDDIFCDKLGVDHVLGIFQIDGDLITAHFSNRMDIFNEIKTFNFDFQ